MRSPRRLCAVVVSGILLAGATPAAAATRYASPTGDASDTSCPQADPCDIQTAVEHVSVANGDVVIVLPGTHALGDQELTVTRAIDLHGVPGLPRPRLTSTSTSFAGVHVNAAARIADLEIDHTPAAFGRALLLRAGAIGERLDVEAHTSGSNACALLTTTLRDSICVGDGGGVEVSAGGGSYTASLRNVTAIGQEAIGVDAVVGAQVSVDARNVIARGTNNDVSSDTDAGMGSSATVDLAYSNYATVDPLGAGSVTPPGSPSNQTAPPLFANAAAGDHHQRLGSPTIDAGSPDSLTGSLDFDRQPRIMRAGIDIGADEVPDACMGRLATVIGTAAANALTGTPGPDVFFAGAGDDVVRALGGDDLVCAGSGEDRVVGAAGADLLLGEGGRDRLLGGGGPDRLLGGAGGDRLVGAAGRDRLVGGAGPDRLLGRGGRDLLLGGGGRDLLLGGRGRGDRCRGGPGRDRRRTTGCERVRGIP